MKKRRPPEEAVFSDSEDCRKKLASYFNGYLPENPDEIADIESLAEFLGTTREGIFAIEKTDEFGFELRKARNRIAKIKKQLAFHGKLPPAVLSFDLKNNHGYKDRNDESCGGDTLVIKGIAKNWAK